MNKLENTGYWHFCLDENNSYAGTLIEENEDINLNLLGCSTVPEKPFIIHGTTATGKKITLSDCYVSGRRMAFPGIPSVEISARFCIKGDHLTSDKLQFNAAQIKISSLHEWVDIGGFEDYLSDDETSSIKYKLPAPIVFYETQTIQFILLFQMISPLFQPKHNFSVTQETVILIKHTAEFDLDSFWKYIAMINSFLTLAYFSEPHLQDIQFKQGEKLLNFSYAGRKAISIDKKNKRDFLFTYKTISTDFKAIFKKWADLNIVVEPVINILQDSFGNRNIIRENRFLNIVQGIETFHRRRRRNEKDLKEVHKEKIKEIIIGCPLAYQSWLKDKLSFSNEPTLHERLEELFGELDSKLKNHLFPDADQLILNTKNSRNYYTHYDARLEKKSAMKNNLFYLSERLKIFLLIILLKEIGIDEEKVNKIIIEGSHFLFNHLIFESFHKQNLEKTNI